ncbi:MAG: HEAT repeat domain-containing protein [Balneolaceae bacterium]|nr:HEAT repeat domain-containing protein [Balneolaceae bacterium]
MIKKLLSSHIKNGLMVFMMGFLFTGISCQSKQEVSIEDLSDEEIHDPVHALLGVDMREGLDITLFASEDMVRNPTNMDVDDRGRVWITEGVNYRSWRNPDVSHLRREEGDRIVILEDTSGDGKADKETVFYQGNEIDSALGIMVLGNKVYVSRSPHVFVFTDTTGNDKADTKEILFQGIGGEDHDHGVHAFVFGPDGKLYFNFGDAGGQIENADGEIIVDQAGNRVSEEEGLYRKGMVFRTNMDGSEFEVLGHNFRNPYEVAVDSYGTLWQSDNDDDGNRSVRINFVMEYGNYGYTDEMTGAGWRTRRVNQEETVHGRHWHQNDPGSVPNVLDTGSGSPTGIIVYEGDLLPEIFHNQMIHTEPGHNVVRAYPVEKDGAGYSGTIENLMVATDNQWIRQVDVTVAPDGSLFIADWYDPGVGGHLYRAPEQGRVYRIAPENTPYRVPDVDYSTIEGAIEALKNPNHETRSRAWLRLNEWGEEAEEALVEVWNSDHSRFRARALWLLSKIDGRGEYYVDQALEDENPDIRITALRAARQLDMDIIPVVEKLVNDPSPQVRREAAIALRDNESADAARLWAELAVQHDGQDRWYLEALGIAADGQWDRYFEAWLERVGQNWNNPAGRDIVWRSRSSQALIMLSEIISDPALDIDEKPRYFRAFHFHTVAEKEQIIVNLLEEDHRDQREITSLVLQIIEPSAVNRYPEVRQALDRTLDATRGTIDYLDLVERYRLEDQHEGLARLVIMYPDSSLGVGAARHMLNYGGQRYLSDIIDRHDSGEIESVVQVLGIIANPVSLDLLQSMVENEDMDFESRQLAVEAFGFGSGESGRNAEDRLLEMLQNDLIPSALEVSAANVLMISNREEIRQEASQYLQIAEMDAGGGIRPVTELLSESGNVENGRQVFERSCQICHQVQGQGIHFGPDLTDIGAKLPKESLYNKIINPDAGINFGYEGNILTLEDGSTVTGINESETETEIVLLLPGGFTERFDQSEISSREIMEQSLMPPLALTMTEEELVDLVEYLSTLRVGN